MAEQKSFWKRYEWVAVVIATLLFVYLVVVFSQKINFLLGNELIVHLTTNQKAFYMHYGEASKAEFNISTENVAYCKALCSYSFYDTSSNEAVEKGSFQIGKGQFAVKSYNLSVKRLGSGQDIYSFDASCSSIRSFLCLTKGSEKSKSALVTVNYDLTETEKELKAILKQNVTKVLSLLNEVDILHQKLNQKYCELGIKADLRNLSKEKIGIDGEYDKMRISAENFRSLWSVENYIQLNQLFDQSIFSNLEDMKNSIESLDESIDSAANLHNGLLSQLSSLSGSLYGMNAFASILGDNDSANLTNISLQNLANTSLSLKKNNFNDYNEIIEKIANMDKDKSSIAEKLKIPSAVLLFNFEHYLKFQSDLLCSLRQDCKGEFSIANITKKADDFLNQYPNTALLNQSCSLLKELNQTYLKTLNETLIQIANKNITFSASDEFLILSEQFKDNITRRINNSYYESFEKIVLEGNTSSEAIGIANLTLPKNNTDISYNEYAQSENLSLYLLSQINLSSDISNLSSKCAKLNEPIGRMNISFEQISTNLTYNITSRIETNLSDNPPICCVFKECKPCCRDDSCRSDPKTFPVIFLHGHSFVKDNSPEFSLEAFNKLQSKLQDDGYLNAGIISFYSRNEPSQQGIWGLSGKPVTVKASYYYDAFRKEDKYIIVPTKTESIDTYALRLKDLIDIVKERTSKPKVNIIAHSMGGLVARRYMQIFGDDDIDKLIMLATPNKGIADAISDYCGLIGENRECADMDENSLFINKLNDPLKQPADR